MKIYMDLLQSRNAQERTTNKKPRRNAVPVKARPVLACDSQVWLYFSSQTKAKRFCFGERGLKLNTAMSYVLKAGTGSVLGWNFKYC
jgi:hypothetical protein